MKIRLLFSKIRAPIKVVAGDIFIIVNLIVWYDYASAILRDIIDKMFFVYSEKLILYVTLFLSNVVFILAGASLAARLTNRKRLLLVWGLIGIVSSLTLTILETATIFNLLIFVFLMGMSFGLGLPACLAIFSDITREENRARFGAVVILLTFIGIFAFVFAARFDLFWNAFILAVWRSLGLICIPLLGPFLENRNKNKSCPMFSLLKDRSLLLYLAPWTMFSMVNYLGWPISSKIYGEDFVYSSVMIGNIVAGIFAIVAGFIADNIGRKRTLLLGFILFGIGYAVLGIDHFNIYAWYLYTFVDGIAWGIFFVIFCLTIWGDLAGEKSSEKYYAIGILPYSLAGFLRVTLGPLIVSTVSEYAIFSFAAFFLFMSVIPLMFAPETLPEKTLRERELRSYIEKAKRVREKFTKG